jgi:SAM-dependent methyltransferase
MGKSLIRIGDFFKVYHKLRQGFAIGGRLKPSSADSRTASAWSHTHYPRKNWGSLPGIEQDWNRRITGGWEKDFRPVIAEKYLSSGPNRALSIGCGTGSNEIKWAASGAFQKIDAFDLSPERIENAVGRAETSGYGDVLNFFVAGFSEISGLPGAFDCVIAENALHHAIELEETVQSCHDALRDGGLFLLKEYVGPDRFQWTSRQVYHSNRMLDRIPEAYRKRWNSGSVKKSVFHTGTLLNWLVDPSEAAKSSRILERLDATFQRLELIQLGGTLLQPVFDDIAHNFDVSDEQAVSLVTMCIEEENKLISTGEIESDFVFAVYRKV